MNTLTKICTVTIDGQRFRGEYTGLSSVTNKHHISLYNGGTLKLATLESVAFDNPEDNKIYTPVIYETGATSHAVNELILFTDNTPKCVDKRDEIYQCIIENKWEPLPIHFIPLLEISQAQYYWEIKAADKTPFTTAEEKEYCEIYANRFKAWKAQNIN